MRQLIALIILVSLPVIAQDEKLCWKMDGTKQHCTPPMSYSRAQVEYDAYKQMFPGPSMTVELKPVRHSWISRHRYAVYFTGLAIGFGYFVYKEYPTSCATVVDGYPYAGTPPCPTWCDKDGCYWPSKPGIKHTGR